MTTTIPAPKDLIDEIGPLVVRLLGRAFAPMVRAATLEGLSEYADAPHGVNLAIEPVDISAGDPNKYVLKISTPGSDDDAYLRPNRVALVDGLRPHLAEGGVEFRGYDMFPGILAIYVDSI